MVNPFTLPALGASLLAAVALGVHLGESSVGLINPIYFQGPALHPRDRGVAIDEQALAPRPAGFADAYGWEEGHAARAADCGDCAALPARDAYAYSAQVPYFGQQEETVAADVRERVAVHAGVPEQVALPAEVVEPRAPALRYVHYPVTTEEAAEFAEAADAVKAEPDENPDQYYQE